MKILEVDYHRNGVAGIGFAVAIVEDPCDEGEGRMLYVSFKEYGYWAAVNLDEAVKGNVYMHPELDENLEYVEGTGGNAWRGDKVAAAIDDAVWAEVERRREVERERYDALNRRRS